jgi:hypothetical protein
VPPGLALGLTISKSGQPTVASGANLTNTITYGNTGTADANGLFFRSNRWWYPFPVFSLRQLE